MKTKNIKQARSNLKKSEDFHIVTFTQVRHGKMSIFPIKSINISIEEILEGLNNNRFSLYDNEFIVLTETIDDDEPKVIANVKSFDTYFGEIEEKDFKKE